MTNPESFDRKPVGAEPKKKWKDELVILVALFLLFCLSIAWLFMSGHTKTLLSFDRWSYQRCVQEMLKKNVTEEDLTNMFTTVEEVPCDGTCFQVTAVSLCPDNSPCGYSTFRCVETDGKVTLENL